MYVLFRIFPNDNYRKIKNVDEFVGIVHRYASTSSGDCEERAKYVKNRFKSDMNLDVNVIVSKDFNYEARYWQHYSIEKLTVDGYTFKAWLLGS